MSLKNNVLVFFTLALATTLFLTGCTPKPIPEREPKSVVEFFDSASFDRNLSSSLKAGFPSVTVVFPASITINSLPKRLDHWLSKVEEYGGEVHLIPVSDTDKGILSEIISLFMAVYDYLKDKAIYSPVKNYNADIYYKKNTGFVTKVMFEVKTPAQADQ